MMFLLPAVCVRQIISARKVTYCQLKYNHFKNANYSGTLHGDLFLVGGTGDFCTQDGRKRGKKPPKGFQTAM